MRRIGGTRRKTRCKLTKSVKERGKLSLKEYFKVFNSGDKVVILNNPTYQDGMAFRRFYGLVGTIIERVSDKRDSCYTVTVSDHGKQKIVIVHPVHMKKVEA